MRFDIVRRSDVAVHMLFIARAMIIGHDPDLQLTSQSITPEHQQYLPCMPCNLHRPTTSAPYHSHKTYKTSTPVFNMEPGMNVSFELPVLHLCLMSSLLAECAPYTGRVFATACFTFTFHVIRFINLHPAGQPSPAAHCWSQSCGHHLHRSSSETWCHPSLVSNAKGPYWNRSWAWQCSAAGPCQRSGGRWCWGGS